MQHIRVVTFTVKAVQDGYKPAAQGWEYDIRIAPDLHEVTPQARKVDQAVSGIVQHFPETGSLEVAPAVPIVPVGLCLYPAIEHDKFGEDFVLVLNTHRFITGDIILCLCRIGGILQVQAAVDTDLIQLFHTDPAFPDPVHRLHSQHTGNTP